MLRRCAALAVWAMAAAPLGALPAAAASTGPMVGGLVVGGQHLQLGSP